MQDIFEMRVEPLNDRFFILHLRASAGTYIKEFVHGDLGRSVRQALAVTALLACVFVCHMGE
jgi:tRNA pseudouridine synthase 10